MLHFFKLQQASPRLSSAHGSMCGHDERAELHPIPAHHASQSARPCFEIGLPFEVHAINQFATALMDGAFARRVANAIYGMLIADALAMPVHWFYNPADIAKQVPLDTLVCARAFPEESLILFLQFGTIRDFQPAPAFHPSSIMNLHSTCMLTPS